MEPNHPNRKPIRLKAYDYAQNGAYFITVCTHDRRNLFWNVGAASGRPIEIPLSRVGVIVDTEIKGISGIYENVSIEKHIVMPNHVHMIIVLGEEMLGRPKDAPTVSRIVQQFKGAVSTVLHLIRRGDEASPAQRR